MRRAHIFGAVLVLSVLGLQACLPGVAEARPVVKMRVAIVPIPIDPSNPHSATYPGTGEFLGAPAGLELEAKIGGTEYWGFPSPLTSVKTYAPAGVRVHTGGFATCSEATLLAKGPEGCPKGSLAGAMGEANAVVSFGDTRVPERATLQGFFNPAGGLIFYDVGYTPALVEVIEKVTVTNAAPVQQALDGRRAVDRIGAGGPGRIGRTIQGQGWRGVQAGREARLLYDRAPHMP